MVRIWRKRPQEFSHRLGPRQVGRAKGSRQAGYELEITGSWTPSLRHDPSGWERRPPGDGRTGSRRPPDMNGLECAVRSTLRRSRTSFLGWITPPRARSAGAVSMSPAIRVTADHPARPVRPHRVSSDGAGFGRLPEHQVGGWLWARSFGKVSRAMVSKIWNCSLSIG